MLRKSERWTWTCLLCSTGEREIAQSSCGKAFLFCYINSLPGNWSWTKGICGPSSPQFNIVAEQPVLKLGLPGKPCGRHHCIERSHKAEGCCPDCQPRALCYSACGDVEMPWCGLGHSEYAALFSWFWSDVKESGLLPCLCSFGCWSWTGSWSEDCIFPDPVVAQTLVSLSQCVWNIKNEESAVQKTK